MAENLLLGRLPHRGPFLSQRGLLEAARRLLVDIAPELDVAQRLGTLSVSQQQLVQIAALGRPRRARHRLRRADQQPLGTRSAAPVRT